MLADDRARPLLIDPGVPGVLGVDDDHGAVAALVQAAGAVDANLVLEARLRDALLEPLQQPFGVTVKAAVRPIGADKNMFAELAQSITSHRISQAV